MSAVLWFGLGVLGYTFIEYGHHRWGGHEKLMGQRILDSHRYHHRDPKEGGVSYPTKLAQRAPLVIGVAGTLGAIFMLALGFRAGGLITAGLVSGYGYSEWFHHRMHHRPPKGVVARWMWKHHYVHHFVDPSVNYGFTSPLWDYVFFTRRDVDSVPVPEKFGPN
ncbi:MAG: sterol desaturase family protein [Myxococcales bacterium]|nr:sterol desaturase family protein [Myxococcales bacterium]